MENFLANLKAWFTTNLVKAGNFTLSNLLPAILVAVIGLVVVILVNKLVTKLLEKSKLEKAGHGLIKTLVRVVLILLFGLICASKLGHCFGDYFLGIYVQLINAHKNAGNSCNRQERQGVDFRDPLERN